MGLIDRISPAPRLFAQPSYYMGVNVHGFYCNRTPMAVDKVLIKLLLEDRITEYTLILGVDRRAFFNILSATYTISDECGISESQTLKSFSAQSVWNYYLVLVRYICEFPGRINLLSRTAAPCPGLCFLVLFSACRRIPATPNAKEVKAYST